MKRILIPVIACVITLSCSSKNGATDAATAETQPDSVIEEVDDAMILTSDGIGPIKIGVNESQLPKEAAGLYDQINVENSDYVLYSFSLGGETSIITEGDGAIATISVSLPSVKTADGVHAGMPVSEVKGKSGWIKNDEGCYENGGIKACPNDPDDPNAEISTLFVGEYSEY